MNILLVDDHPMTAEGYKNSIQAVFGNEQVFFDVAYTCEDAYSRVSNKISSGLDMAILDHGLPPYRERGILSGSDLGVFIKETFPKCKVIIITAHTEVIIIYDIYKKVRPDALIIKTDITPASLPEIVSEISVGGHYISNAAKKCISEIWKKDLMVEDCNRQILYYLSKGYRVKELGDVIPLASSTIQRRVINMKKAFDVSDDNSLIKEAIRQGFV